MFAIVLAALGGWRAAHQMQQQQCSTGSCGQAQGSIQMGVQYPPMQTYMPPPIPVPVQAYQPPPVPAPRHVPTPAPAPPSKAILPEAVNFRFY